MDVDNMSMADMEHKSSARSCTTCSKAKAKCVRQPGREICERCARLKKECYSREPVVRQRKGVVKTTRAAQLEKLENKIEHLVNALASAQSQRGSNVELGQHSPMSQASDKAIPRSDMISSLCEAMDEQDPPVSIPESTPTSSSVYTTSPAHYAPPIAQDVPREQSFAFSLAEAEMLLDRYQRLQAPHYPFVRLHDATAQDLRLHKPVLLQAILTVAFFHDYPRQQILVKQLIRDISERVLINCERSLDVLQGILVLLGWFHPHVFTMLQTNNLLHLAQALATDLGLDRPVQTCPDLKLKHGKQGPAHRSHATIEEHRAYAGVFFMTSMFASSFRRMTSMRRSKYFDEVLTSIEREREDDSDLFLVQMVRIQLVIDDVSCVEAPTAPTHAYSKAFLADLDHLTKKDALGQMDTNMMLRLQRKAAEIMVWELSLNELLESNVQKPLRPHLDNLCQCVKAVKAFLDVFFLIPPSSYLALPFPFYGQFAHTFFALLKMASLEVDGWDMGEINAEFSFSDVMETMAQRYEKSSTDGPDGIPLNNESFTKWGGRVRMMKQVFASKVGQDGGEQQTHQSRSEVSNHLPNRPGLPLNGYEQPPPAIQQPTPPDDVLSGDFFNYLDENFWQSFAGDGMDLAFSGIAMS